MKNQKQPQAPIIQIETVPVFLDTKWNINPKAISPKVGKTVDRNFIKELVLGIICLYLLTGFVRVVGAACGYFTDSIPFLDWPWRMLFEVVHA